MTINLGDHAKDMVTGFEGICIARTEWLNGCVRCTIQSAKLKKDGQPADTVTFDEEQLRVVRAGKVRADRPWPLRKTGGPGPEPERQAGPQRR